MVRVKVCGITNVEDALKAVYYGAWAIGFIFTKKSPRYISPSRARKIIDALPPFVEPVGVFVDLSQRAVIDICSFTNIRTVQFHGHESASYCGRFKEYKIIKAFHIGSHFPMSDIAKYHVSGYLFDTFKEGQEGGTGQAFDWEILKGHKIKKPFILSGGLNADNAREAIKSVNPYALDVSSGVESSPGVKNPAKIRAFFESIYSN